MHRAATGMLAVLLALAGCAPRAGGDEDAGPRRRAVEQYLAAMVAGDEAAQRALISPAWLAENDVDINTRSINKFLPRGYEVTRVSGERVTAVIKFFPNTHRLVFRVVKEDDAFYVWPGPLDWKGWIQPWQEIQRFVR